MKNWKESILYKGVISVVWVSVLIITTLLISNTICNVKNTIVMVLILIPTIILWIISLIIFIDKWEDILKSEDPEKDS